MTGTATARMPPALAALADAEQLFINNMAGKALFGAPDKMLAVEAKLRTTITPGSELPEKYICRAVAAFHAKGADRLSRREVRALCAGLNHSCSACGGASLMQQGAPETLYELFTRVRRAFRENQLKLESWYDLVHSYLGAKERTVCCEMLREFLLETLPTLGAPDAYPFHWLRALSANRDILDKEPCKGAAEQAVKGHIEEIESLRRQLGIPDASWFWKELTVARALQATQLDDAAFTAAVPALVQALQFLPDNLKDRVIRQFLERCVKCHEPSMPNDLRVFTVDCWGPPLPGTHPKYDHISHEARLLVQERLVRDDMKDFLMLLQTGGANERKLAFWNRYIKSIDYHRILLGPNAQRIPQPDVARLRSRPSVGKLAGADANNALLMKIGNWLVVESAGAESPLFGYRFAQLPFNLQEAEIDLPCFRKAATADFKLQRQDTLEGQWEDKLAPELATLGIRRDEGPAGKRKSPPPSAPQPSASGSPVPSSTPFDEELFRNLVRDGHLQAEDTRKQGGFLWVVGDLKDNYYLIQRLAASGFRWKPGRGWWKS